MGMLRMDLAVSLARFVERHVELRIEEYFLSSD
jgi:hypothetical protein